MRAPQRRETQPRHSAEALNPKFPPRTLGAVPTHILGGHARRCSSAGTSRAIKVNESNYIYYIYRPAWANTSRSPRFASIALRSNRSYLIPLNGDGFTERAQKPSLDLLPGAPGEGPRGGKVAFSVRKTAENDISGHFVGGTTLRSPGASRQVPPRTNGRKTASKVT